MLNGRTTGAYKSVDQSTGASNTTFMNDSELFAPINSGTYQITLNLRYEGGTQGASDIKIAFDGPAGLSIVGTLSGFNTSGVYTPVAVSGSSGSSLAGFGTNGAGVSRAATFTGTVTCTASGTLQFKFAQNGANSTPTIVHAGSSFQVVQIA